MTATINTGHGQSSGDRPPVHELIETEAALAGLCRRITAAGAVALDTESDSFHHYHQKVCLIQAALPAGDMFIIDPLRIKDLAPLAEVMRSARTLKLLHGADYDVRSLKAAYAWEINNIFDTMPARRLLGPGLFGLAALTEEFLGVILSKHDRKSDWSLRPLTASMVRYALDDVRYLFSLQELLSRKLLALGRLRWAQEEAADIAALPPLQTTGAADGFWDLKGFRLLSPRAQAIVKEFYLLRERAASRLDVATFRVWRNEVMLAMAAAAAAGEDPWAVKGLSASFLRAHRDELDKALQCGRQAGPPARRRRTPNRYPHPSPAIIKELGRVRAEAAQKLNLDIGFLCPGELFKSWASDREARLNLEGLKGWRREALEAPLRQVLRKFEKG